MQHFEFILEHLNLSSWASIVGALHLIISIGTVMHILLKKENEGSAVSWIGVVLLSPFLGAAIYWMFGISHIKRKSVLGVVPQDKQLQLLDCTRLINAHLPEKWQGLMKAGCAIHHAPYHGGNQIRPLKNGDEAYPQMIAAIQGAQHSVFLSSYIFDYDAVGRAFIDALEQAHKRQVDVYVLIDGIGTSVTWRRAMWTLNRKGVKTARFLPKRFLSSMRFINLRNHRKILSVDGKIAFMGGLNISHDNMLADKPSFPVQDIHFEVRGPVIKQINQSFVEDWIFSTNQMIEIPDIQGNEAGGIISRILPDGPDQNSRKLAWTLLSALNAAERNIRIMTPYFIPDDVLSSALQAAALRGVKVEIIVPKKSNIWFFDLAMRASFKQYLSYDVKIYQSPRPFDHSKIFVVDEMWSFIGSSNWDARSLILNFEINLECYDDALNSQLHQYFEDRKAVSEAVTAVTYKLPWQLVHNLVRLFSPYL